MITDIFGSYLRIIGFQRGSIRKAPMEHLDLIDKIGSAKTAKMIEDKLYSKI
jgi:hypothetical protein